VRVVITGANSAVGQAILRLETQKRDPPLTVVAAVRSDRAVNELPPLPHGHVVRISYDDPSSLKAAFAGASAVIHLAGILVERSDSTYETANVQTTRSVAEAAESCAVQKLVFVSAIGAHAASPNRYWRTKGEAEALIRACRCAHTILRVPLLLGPGTEGTAALQHHLSRKTVVLPGGGRNRQQPLYVDDLAHAAILAADPLVARNRTLDLVGPVSLPDREILQRGARLLGRDVRIRSMPIMPLRLALALRRRFASAGFSPDALDVITADTQLDPNPAAAEIGIRLTGLEEMISQSLRPMEQGR
jgi:NADH dehydrogenase